MREPFRRDVIENGNVSVPMCAVNRPRAALREDCRGIVGHACFLAGTDKLRAFLT